MGRPENRRRLTGNRARGKDGVPKGIRDGDALHHEEGRLLKAHDAAKSARSMFAWSKMESVMVAPRKDVPNRFALANSASTRCAYGKRGGRLLPRHAAAIEDRRVGRDTLSVPVYSHVLRRPAQPGETAT